MTKTISAATAMHSFLEKVLPLGDRRNVLGQMLARAGRKADDLVHLGGIEELCTGLASQMSIVRLLCDGCCSLLDRYKIGMTWFGENNAIKWARCGHEEAYPCGRSIATASHPHGRVDH
jgi:hypothetical protein